MSTAEIPPAPISAKVLLRCKQTATLTHIVPGPFPWRLLGRLDHGGEIALWTASARFTDTDAKHRLDIVGIDIGETPVTYAPFTGLKDLGQSGGAS